MVWILGILVLIVFHYHMYGMGMRYIGDMPLEQFIRNNGGVAWATVLPVCRLYAAIQLL